MAECCAICMEEGTDLMALPGCGHTFHAACALTFAQYDLRCPVCRQVPEGAAPRAESASLHAVPTLVMAWNDVEVRVVRADADEDEDEDEDDRRAWTRYAARRRRALRRHPRLRRMFDELGSLRRAHERACVETQRTYDRRCREVWRADAEVAAHRAAVARLRRRERVVARRLHAALEPLLGPEPG